MLNKVLEGHLQYKLIIIKRKAGFGMSIAPESFDMKFQQYQGLHIHSTQSLATRWGLTIQRPRNED